MSQFKPLSWVLVTALLLEANVPGFALELGNDHLHVSGFATLAATSSGKEGIGFRRDLEREGVYGGDWSLLADSSLGLQLDFFVTDNFGGAIQYLAKDRVETSFENSIEWAFLRYQPHQDWTIRAGRIGFDLFMLSEYRNVGFAYLWSRPPLEYYGILSIPNFDGLDLAWTMPLGEGNLRVKAISGDTRIHIKFGDQKTKFEPKDLIGVTIGWESERWRIRASANQASLGEENEYLSGSEPLAYGLLQTAPLWPEAAALADSFLVKDDRVIYYALGLAYTDNPWQIQSELSYADSKTVAFTSQIAGYFSLGYQIDHFTPYVILSTSRTEGDPTLVPDPPPIPIPAVAAQLNMLQAGTQFFYDAFRIDQDGLSVGLRWDIRYDMALKAQWDHSRVNQHGYALWEGLTSPQKGHAINTLSINWNVVF